MTVVGFNFKSMKAERTKPIEGKINVQNSVKIDDISESQLIVGDKKNKTLKFDFSYTSSYSPEIGVVEIKGSLVFMADPKKVDEIIKNWKKDSKDKKVPDEVMAPVLNTILNKCSITALQMSRDVNLPPQIQLPKVKVK